MDWSNVEINGTGLGAFLAGPESDNWQQFNSVWSSTLLDQTSWVGSGDSFTITDAGLTCRACGRRPRASTSSLLAS
jgi:hypothetical protein